MNGEKIPLPIKRFQTWLDKFEQEEPNWLSLATLWIFKGALQSLRAFIDDPKEPEINWANPWAELQWDVEWDWASMQALSFTFTEEAWRDNEAAASQTGKAAASHISLYALHLLTRKVALLKQGEDFSYLLPQDITKTVNEMAENDRGAYLEKLYEPLLIGAIEAPGELPEDGPVPEEVAAQLQEKLADFDDLGFKGEAGGVPFEANLVFQFHPLVIDEDERRAYYPIICGMAFTPIDESTPPTDPSTWTPQDRENLWEAIFASIDKSAEGLTTWRPEIEAEPPIYDIALPAIQDNAQLLTVGGAKNYREVQKAFSQKAFCEMHGTPWPTAPFSEGGFMQLRPPQFEAQLLPPEEMEKLADSMFKQIKDLSDVHADFLDIMTFTWISQAGNNPNSRAVADIDKFIAMRGLTPKHSGRGKAFRKEQRQEALRAITHILCLWLDMGEVEIFEGKGKTRKDVVVSRAYTITDIRGQRRLDGFVDAQKIIYVPGAAFAMYLLGSGRQVAMLRSKALEYDPYRQKPEKRLTRYFAWYWRTQAKTGIFIHPLRVETLLEEVGEDAISLAMIEKRPGDARERLEKALERLREDNVISAWQYVRWDEAISERRGWFAAYQKTTVLIEAPDDIKTHYKSVFENTRNRIAKATAKATAKKTALPAPEPAPRIDGLGEKLKQEREKRKLTQLQMAEILEVSPPYVSQIENGRVNPGAKLKNKIRAWISEPG